MPRMYGVCEGYPDGMSRVYVEYCFRYADLRAGKKHAMLYPGAMKRVDEMAFGRHVLGGMGLASCSASKDTTTSCS